MLDDDQNREYNYPEKVVIIALSLKTDSIVATTAVTLYIYVTKIFAN